LTFSWNNLTLACTECNRRKNDYHSGAGEEAFLDPYSDDVESTVKHCGPIVCHSIGERKAEIAVTILELDNHLSRKDLVERKAEKLQAISNLLTRYANENNQTMKRIIRKQIKKVQEKESEFSAMVRAYIRECCPTLYEQ